MDDPAPLKVNDAQTIPTDIRVYIAGAVQNPGVYPLEEDDRWIDALEAAGGPTSDANLDAVNLSQRVQDEDQIFVPRLGNTDVAGVNQAPLININSASREQLESLPGIGAARAQSILASRVSDGPFAAVDDLLYAQLDPRIRLHTRSRRSLPSPNSMLLAFLALAWLLGIATASFTAADPAASLAAAGPTWRRVVRFKTALEHARIHRSRLSPYIRLRAGATNRRSGKIRR